MTTTDETGNGNAAPKHSRKSGAIPFDSAVPQDTPAGGSPASAAVGAGSAAQDRPYRPAYGEPTRKPALERDSAFNAVAWLLEGATGVYEEMRHNDLGLSEEFWMHASAARREALLAMRTAIDDILARSTTAEQQQEQRDRRREQRGGIDIDS
jgi:sarcosine oxidase delta subunit